MRTLNQLQSNLKDGYKITCQVTTVKAFIEECVEMGLTK